MQALCKERNVPRRSDVTVGFFVLFFGLEPRMPIPAAFSGVIVGLGLAPAAGGAQPRSRILG